jgi:hypothetical protein
LADISQLAVGSIPNLPRPSVFGKRVGLNPNIFQSSENRAIARCNRKTRQLDFRKAEAKLAPAAVSGRVPSGIRGCPAY